MRQHLNIRFFGDVQGVFFRQFISDKAAELGIVGFVRNEADGTVYTEAEGEEAILNKLISLAKKGPGKVTDVTTTTGNIKNFSDFKIEY